MYTVKSLIEDGLLFNFRISDRASIQDFQKMMEKFREINFLRASIQDAPLFETRF